MLLRWEAAFAWICLRRSFPSIRQLHPIALMTTLCLAWDFRGLTAAQANLVGFNNLYVNDTGTGFCPGTAPNVLFAYNITLSHRGQDFDFPNSLPGWNQDRFRGKRSWGNALVDLPCLNLDCGTGRDWRRRRSYDDFCDFVRDVQ